MASKKKHIQIYDTTLRDGAQSENITFTVGDKLRICTQLDQAGFDYIEAGWPGASPKDTDFFDRAKKELKLKHAKLVAFGSTRKASNSPEKDKILNDLIAAQTKVVCIFGKTWDLHVRSALRISLKENLKLITDSVAYLKKAGREVIYDAEHFFDGYKANKKYALDTLQAASKGGADRIVLCDTNGGTLPDEIEKLVKDIKSKMRMPLGIHCHNDSGTAVANSMAAVKAGVTQVQGCVNGIGERCGNANLVTIVANLELKLGFHCIGAPQLKNLRELSLFVDEMANRASDARQPYVGLSAFAHKGGMHVNAILKNSKTYEHIDPTRVGNQQRILLSDYSGASTMFYKLKKYGVDISATDPHVTKLLTTLKDKENQGYHYEGAEGSFEILVKKAMGDYKPHFELKDFRVTDEVVSDSGGKATSEAEVHLAVNGHEEKTTAKGVGPVHAIDQALRGALERFYPSIAQMKLLDYKVRVLPANLEGTAATVRVLIEFGDDKTQWGTIGVSENIIHASYQALVDGIDFKLFKDRV